jgi:hypothetical protein
MKERQIPEGATEHLYSEAKVTLYYFKTDKGYPALLAYKGRSKKPIICNAYSTTSMRNERAAIYVKQEKENEDYKRSLQKPHELAVGDILYASWGYEQTNINFYQVLKIPTEISAIVREVNTKSTMTSSMSGTKIPILNDFKDQAEQRRRTAGVGNLKGGRNFQNLYFWNGKPKEYTTYA